MIPLKPPVSKKNWKKGVKEIHFPIFDENQKLINETSLPAYHGIFNGKVVVIEDPDEKARLSSLGSYGQLGVFDKMTFVDYKTLQNQVLKQKKNWQAMKLISFEFPNNNEKYSTEDESEKAESLNQNVQTSANTSTIYTLNSISNDDPASSSSKWKELKTSCTKEYNELLILSGHEHHIPYYLLLEEAFFLCYTLECLEIKDENDTVINILDCWEKFNGLRTNFPFFYAAYHYYRSKGWAVKPGQQYGGDFVLYKSSPIYYHSSYVVVININGQNSDLLSSWPSWFGCGRAVETASKDLLVCVVHGPEYEKGMLIDLTQYNVSDIIVRRWVPSQNREHQEYEKE